MSRKLLLSLVLVLSLWATARFTHYQTKGFRLLKLHHNTSSDVYDCPLPKSLQPTFDQSFHYLGRGKQSFSFVSEDGTVVLKLFNNQYQNRLLWLEWIPNWPFLKPWKEKQIAYNDLKLQKAFSSYTLAFETLKEEAGLLFFHPSTSSDCPQVTLIDNLNICHRLDLSKTAFVLQKKALSAYPYLDLCAADDKKFKQALTSLFSLIQKKMALGIHDNDPLIRTNMGFFEGQAMQIDIGPFSLDPELKNVDRQKTEIVKITQSLKHWLEQHHPELIPSFEDILKDFI